MKNNSEYLVDIIFKKLKGYKANYFYLPNKSNSTEKVYKVFIGPYEHIEETNQWIKNLEGEIEIISL